MDPMKLYGRTKLAMILGTKYGLVEQVIKPNGDDIYAIAVHPGAVCTCLVLFYIIHITRGGERKETKKKRR